MNVIDCPACPRTSLPEDTLVCPNCGVDLAPILRIRQLGHSYFNDSLRLIEAGDLASALQRIECAVSIDGDSADARVLKGKILWKLGRHDDARNQWRGVKITDPSFEKAATLVEAHKDKKPNWIRLAVATTMIVVLAVLIAVATGTLNRTRREEKPQTGSAPGLESVAKVPAAEDQSEALERRIINDPAFLVERAEHGTKVVFSEGLFASGSDALTDRGEVLLSNLSDAIRALGSPLAITVEGHTDDQTPKSAIRQSDNWTLGLSRAATVAAYLRKQGVDGPALNITSMGELVAPFPNATADGRQKNRTIVLFVKSARK